MRHLDQKAESPRIRGGILINDPYEALNGFLKRDNPLAFQSFEADDPLSSLQQPPGDYYVEFTPHSLFLYAFLFSDSR